MTPMDGEPDVPSGSPGAGARFGGTANGEASTDIRGDIAPDPC